MSWDHKLFQWHLTTRRFGRELVHCPELDSTNRWLFENHRQFAISGGVIIADHQTAGRGRQERVWFDLQEQSLLFSILLRQHGGDANLALLSFLPAIALGEWLREQLCERAHVELKWPNDVLLNGKKIAGVLGQTSGNAAERMIVLGMGINAHGNAGNLLAELAGHASTIEAETGVAVAREILLAELLNRMEPLYDHILSAEANAVCERWLRLGPPLGMPVTRRECTSEITGKYEGLGAHGELLLRDDSGTIREIISGDIAYR